jgi:phosphoglycolate phosphatase
MKIFFDLDGTLLDSKQRLYELFQILVPQSIFTFETYWDLKQDKVSHRELLTKYFGYTESEISKFTSEWMDLIESSEWLERDTLFCGVKPFLDKLKEKSELYVVTARQFEDRTINQIENLGLNNIFTDVLVTLQKNEKSDLIKKYTSVTAKDWIVGDTGNDVLTGKELGLSTAAVLSGFLSKKHLLTYSPDIIVDKVELLKF